MVNILCPYVHFLINVLEMSNGKFFFTVIFIYKSIIFCYYSWNGQHFSLWPCCLFFKKTQILPTPGDFPCLRHALVVYVTHLALVDIISYFLKFDFIESTRYFKLFDVRAHADNEFRNGRMSWIRIIKNNFTDKSVFKLDLGRFI